MKLIGATRYALYYRARYGDRDLICICESTQVADVKIAELMDEYPHCYDERARFEIDPVRYERRAY